MLKVNLIILAFSVVILSAVGIYAWNLSRAISQPLPAVEIEEYWGENFLRANDIRRNSRKEPETVDLAKYFLVVNGLVAKPTQYSFEQLMKLPEVEKTVTLHCIEGWKARIIWEGFLVKEILTAAKVNPRAKVAIFYGVEGDTTTLSLDTISDKKIMVAYKMNGMTLAVQRGYPSQLVAEKKLGSNWLKSITRIEIADGDYGNSYAGVWPHSYSGLAPQGN